MLTVNDIYIALEPLFPQFKLDKDEEGFIRRITKGVQKILVPVSDRSPEFEFSVICCIRLDEVEDICNRFNTAPPHYHSMTLTSTTPLEYFGRDKYSVSTPRELQSSVADLASVSADILRFMNQHQDVCSVQYSTRSCAN